MILADEDLHLRAQLVKRAGQLAGDVAAADDGDAPRPLRELEEAVRSDAVLGPGQQRPRGLAAGRDHDVPRGQALPVDLDGIAVQDVGGAAQKGHALGREVALIDAVQAQHIGVALALQIRPIAVAQCDVESVVVGVGETLGDARRVPHDLLGNAAHVHARASQAVRFDHGRLGAIFGRALRAGQAAAAAAHADEIEGLVPNCELRAQMTRKPNDILRPSITRVWGVAVIGVVVILVGIYNGLVNLRENVKVAWANIDVLLKQRHDELPKLVDACKRYMQFEQETLEKVMRARASVSLASSAGNVAAVGAAEQQLRAGVGRLFAVAENYPQLKTDETFKQLQGRIIALEESIADRRELYNDQVNLNNIRVNVFPDAVIARKYGFLPAQLLEFASEEKRDVNVGALFGT